MSGIFPVVQPEAAQAATEQLPLCKEIAWDYKRGIPIFSGGRPLVVEGKEAVKVWAWKALNTQRFCHDIYTWAFGCEAQSLVGRSFTSAVKESEAMRYVREALAPNPYITDVRQVKVEFSDTMLAITCEISTVYGEVRLNV